MMQRLVCAFHRSLLLASLLIISDFNAAPTQLAGKSPDIQRVFPAGAQRGVSANVEVTGDYSLADTSVWSDCPGMSWRPSGKEKTFEVTVNQECPPGQYWLRFHNQDGCSEPFPFLVGAESELSEVEPNDRVRDGNLAAELPMLCNGVLQKRGDVDGYRVLVPKGMTLVGAVTANQQLKSPVDMTLQVVSLDGHVLAQNLDYHGLDPLILFTAPQDMEVIVRVFGFPETPNSTIAFAGDSGCIYRLLLTTGPYLEGSTPLALRADQETILQLHGWNLNQAGTTEWIVAADPGLATLHRRRTISVPGMAGSLELPVVDIELFNESRLPSEDAGANAVGLPAVFSGVIDAAGDVDRYSFEAKKDSRWRFEVESRALSYPLDPIISIVDQESGKVLAQQDDNGKEADPRLDWKAPADGIYLFEITDVNGFGGPGYHYRATIHRVEGSFHAVANATQYRGSTGEVVKIEIEIDRRDGFSDDIKFVLVDPPKGCQFEPVVSTNEGDTKKKVVLSLNFDVVIHQPIRVAGVLPSGQEFPVYSSGPELPTLWLTVAGKSEEPETAGTAP